MMNSDGDSSSLIRLGSMNNKLSSTWHHDRRSTSAPPRGRTSKSPFKSKRVFTLHQLFVLSLIQILSMTANAMIYLEDPIQALIYDSLPDPPDRDTISNVFLSNLTEGALDNVRFKVGTPLHYLTVVQSSDEEASLVTPIVSSDGVVPEDEDLIEEDTSLFTGNINATTTLFLQNETATITNYTDDTNETISSSTNNNMANSTILFDRLTTSAAWEPDVVDDPPISSPVSSPITSSSSSSSIPTRVISGKYTDIIYHKPQTTANNADILITGSEGKTLTITELLGFFNDTKLVFPSSSETEEEEKYLYYDSRQARFGSDFGPKGNAAFVNIMFPPRWGEEDLVVDLGEMGEEGVEEGVHTYNVVIEGSDGNVTTNTANRTIDNEIGSSPEDDEPERMRGLEDVDHLLGFHDESQTNVTEMEESQQVNVSDQTQTTEENNQTDENVTIDTTIASANETVNATVSVNKDEEFIGQFDTHISSYFCLDDFISWKSKLSGFSGIPPAGALPSSSNNAINSTRGIALLVQRGRCSFENKAELAMVFNDLLASSGKSNRIDHIIVYNNGTIDKNNNNGTDGEEQLVEITREPHWNDSFYANNKKITVGMLYVTTLSGLDLFKRMSERQNEVGISPYMDISWIRGRHLISKSTKDDGQHVGSLVEDSTVIHDDAITNGWFFPATLTRFCLSCGKDTDYGFYPFVLAGDGDNQHRPGQFAPTNWPNVFSDDYYQPQRWVEMIRRLMIGILVILLVGPVVLATHRWHHVGGTIRFANDENGRRRVRVISPNLEVFVNGVPDTVETNGTKLDRAQVFALPEIVYSPSLSVSGSNISVNEDSESPLASTNIHDDNDAENGSRSPDSFRENDHRCNNQDHDNIPSLTAPITPPGSEASDMYASSSCCPICIEEFEPGETLRVLPCNHLFHTECILPWLTKRQGCCPQCRTPVLPEEFQSRRTSSPLRRSSVLRSFLRERRQEREESDSALTPTRLFTEIEHDLEGDDTTANNEMPQESRGTAVPYGVEENESRSLHEGQANHSSPESQLSDHNVSGNTGIGVTATVSADDIENSVSTVSPGDDEEDRLADIANAAGVSESNDTSNRDAFVEDDFVGDNNRDSHEAESSIPKPPSVSRNNDNGFNAFLSFLNAPSIAGQESGDRT